MHLERHFLCEKKSCMWGKGQSEPTPMIALVDHSIHRMGYVFHLLLYLMLTNILLQLIFFGCWLLTLNPQSYPIDLHLSPAYELTTNPFPTFYLLVKHIFIPN